MLDTVMANTHSPFESILFQLFKRNIYCRESNIQRLLPVLNTVRPVQHMTLLHLHYILKFIFVEITVLTVNHQYYYKKYIKHALHYTKYTTITKLIVTEFFFDVKARQQYHAQSIGVMLCLFNYAILLWILHSYRFC